MRKIRQLMAMLLCMSMLLIFTPDVAGADTIGDKGLDETLFQEWAEESGGRFTAEALKEFALNLQNEYVPRILGGITETFSFAQKPSAEGMKIRLKLYNNSYKKADLASVTSNGTGYLLSVNMAALEATEDKKVDPDGDYGSFYGSLAHEMMHAVMFDVTSAGMLADRDWHGSGYTEYVDEFPDWFYEGIAQTVGGGVEWCGKLKDDLYAIQPQWESRNKEKETKEWLSKFYWLGNESYAQGYIACLYLGHAAGGETDRITSANIVKGLNDIVLDVEDGYSLSQAIYRQTEGRYTSIEDFQQKFPDDAYQFSMDFLDAIDAGSSDVSWHATGSLLAREGLGVSKLVMYKGLMGKSDYFTLDISHGEMYDNSAALKERAPRTGGGMTKTKGLRRDGSVNTDAKTLWTAESYKESDVTDDSNKEEVKPEPSPGPGEEVKPEPSPEPGEEVKPSPSPGLGEEVKPSPSPEPGEEVKPSPSPEPGEEVRPSPSPGPGEEVKPSPSPEPGEEVKPEPSPGPGEGGGATGGGGTATGGGGTATGGGGTATGGGGTSAVPDEKPAAEQPAEAPLSEEAVKDIKLKLRSQLVKTKSGKKAIRLTWTNPGDIELDGVEIYRSLKKNSGYGRKPIFISKSGSYTNSAVKKGTCYYYKVRGFVNVDGQKLYTAYSGKASRTVK